MYVPIFIVDAFATVPFTGNPAAVCPLDAWLEDHVLQSIAAENNLAETAFFVPVDGEVYDLRWFTPTFEIPLCGHATLASAYVLFTYLGHSEPVVRFQTMSGPLSVKRQGDLLTMDFPAYETEPTPLTEHICAAIGGRPVEFLKAGINLYAIFTDEMVVRGLKPDFVGILDVIRDTDYIGIVATAPGHQYDFVSRYFAPEEGVAITEDPVTGSIHSVLVPFWAHRLGRSTLTAYQASCRGGELFCELISVSGTKRALIGGYVQPYLQGTIEIQRNTDNPG